MALPSRPARDVLVRFGARVLSTVAQAATLMILARSAGPESFGEFGVGIALGSLASAALSMGASVRILRVAAEERGEMLAGAFLVIRIVGSLITFAVCTTLLLFGFPAIIVFAAAALSASDLLLDYVQALYAGRDQQTASSAVLAVQRLVPLSLILIAFTTGASLFAALIIGVTATAVLLTSWVKRSVVFLGGVRETIRSSLGYWVAGLGNNFSQMEPIVLRVFATPATVGGFTVATRLINPLTIFVSVLRTVMLPKMAAALGSEDFTHEYRRLLRASTAYAVVLAVAAVPIASLAILALGPGYEFARALLTSMVIASALAGISQAFQAKLIAQGRPLEAAFPIVVGVIVGLCFMIGLVHMTGEGKLWLWPLFTFSLITALFGYVAHTSSTPRWLRSKTATAEATEA